MTVNNNKYSIYVAERPERDESGDSVHTFLLLVEEQEGAQSVVQQLHYIVDPMTSTILPNARVGISDPKDYPERFSNLMASRVMNNEREYVLAKWNHALQYAFQVKYSLQEGLRLSEDFQTEETAVNCRAAVIATLNAIDVETTTDQFARTAGTKCSEMPVFGEFNAAAANKTYDQLMYSNGVYMSNLELKLVTADGITPKRYNGALAEPFLPMRQLEI
ncbi:MAG: hypothetical protein ACRBB3_09040 [Alphaproteobacteria bacterium]